MRVHTCTETDRARWDEFVASHGDCTSYHRWNWKHVFRAVFGWPATYLLAEEGHRICGILPLIRQNSLWRSFLSSMPHLKAGGIIADQPDTRYLLLSSAIEIARDASAAYLELRQAAEHDLPLVTRDDKVGAVLGLEQDADERLRRLDKKTRNLVRKSLTFGMQAEFGRSALLADFYEVYRHNMHDLGSPSYSRTFFSEILTWFPRDSRICVVRLRGEPVSAAFLIGFRKTIEVAWASSYRKFLAIKPNMFLYWSLLTFAVEEGYEFLDLGRSSRSSGTYDFKLQWGAAPSALHWAYWLNDGAKLPSTHTHRMQLARRIWQHLPIAITNLLGPKLIKFIPAV